METYLRPIMALDIGTKRIGTAISDPFGIFATAAFKQLFVATPGPEWIGALLYTLFGLALIFCSIAYR